MSQAQNTMININEILGPVLMLAVFKGQDISPILDAMINSKITETILDKLAANVPQEYQDIVDVLKLAAQMDTVNGVVAAIRGRKYEPKFGLDKAVEIVLMLNLAAKLGGSQGGAAA